MKIAIVNSSSFGKIFPEHIDRLRKLGEVERFYFPVDISGEDLAKELEGFHAIIASVTPTFSKEFFEINKDVVLIARHGIGVNNVDLEAATENGVIVTKVPGEVEREAMAEHTVTLMLAVMRKIFPAYDDVKKGLWKNRARHVGMELRGRTVGIIGIGNIGSRVAEILKNSFGANVIAYDPNLTDEEIEKRHAKAVDFDYLVKNSDVITLHAPLTNDTYHMISEKEFSMMKDGVVIIDTARGELIDTKALIKALDDGKVFGVGMDVVEGEPIDENHPLLRYENVIIVPHIGAYTYECLKGMGDKVVEDVERVAKGEMPSEVVNPEVLKRRKRLDEFSPGR